MTQNHLHHRTLQQPSDTHPRAECGATRDRRPGQIELTKPVATNAIVPGQAITEEVLLEIHRRLMAGGRSAQHAGQWRTVQNWIGGSSFNPCGAESVPPPPELVPELVDFGNRDDLPAVAQAAIAHAQFETIHPFVDGNGRTGRALIHLVLRSRGLMGLVAPVSLILATWSDSYIDGLERFRYVGRADSRQALDDLNIWVARFAAACTRAAEDAVTFEMRARELEEAWRAFRGGPCPR